MDRKISLIIPAYNEENRLGKTLNTVFEYLTKNYSNFEILVVDDGSKDKTIEVAKQFSVNVIAQPKNLGKGAAVKTGMLAANGDIRVFSDADLSTPIYEIKKIVNKIESGYDIAIGSRAVDFSMIKVHQPFHREWMGRIFNKIVQFLAVKGIKDTQCGFKGFTAESATKIFSNSKIDGFGFDVEALFLANKFNYKIAEVPVEWYNDERSKVDPVKDSLKMFSDILRVRRLHSK